MKCELCLDDCLDLPSLTQIQGNQDFIHYCMGYVILESMIWFDLIWFDLIWLDIPNLTENNIHYGIWSFLYTADLQSTSTFLFHFRFYLLDADGLRDFVIPHSEYNLVQGMQKNKRYFILPNQSIEDIPTDIQHLFICGLDEYRDETLILSNNSFHQLKSITIGYYCFENVREFVLDGLESLESVKIGEFSLSINDEEKDDGICRIVNCPNLRQLEIGDNSFEDFKSFELSNLNSIQSIKFGNSCFYYADFSLKGEWKGMKERNMIWMKMKMMI